MFTRVGHPDQPDMQENEHELACTAVLSGEARADDLDRQMDTLIEALGNDLAQQFFWKAETDTIQTYEHRLTYRYVHIDSVTGRFCDQQRAPISAQQALEHALQAFPSSLLLAPIVLEPNLLPFVRRVDLATERQDRTVTTRHKPQHAAKSEGLIARLQRVIRARFSAIAASAETAVSVPALNPLEAQRSISGDDLALAAFTRRIA